MSRRSGRRQTRPTGNLFEHQRHPCPYDGAYCAAACLNAAKLTILVSNDPSLAYVLRQAADVREGFIEVAEQAIESLETVHRLVDEQSGSDEATIAESSIVAEEFDESWSETVASQDIRARNLERATGGQFCFQDCLHLRERN